MYGRPGGKLTEPILVGLCGSVWVSGLYLNAPDPDIDHLEIVLIFQASLGMGNGRYWMEFLELGPCPQAFGASFLPSSSTCCLWMG